MKFGNCSGTHEKRPGLKINTRRIELGNFPGLKNVENSKEFEN